MIMGVADCLGRLDLSIIIGSFNLYKFKGESNKKSAKNLKMIAKIIKNEGFDIIALQEVFNDKQLKVIPKSIVNYLGEDYECIWQPTHGYIESYAEGYAFIWNTKKFRQIGMEDGELYKRHRAKKKLVRPPLMARFIPRSISENGFIELRLITTHMIFNKPPKESGTDTEFRRKELKVLTEEIYPDIADDRYGNNRPAYTILMGDYNLCLTKTPRLDDEVDKTAGFFEKAIPNSRIPILNLKKRIVVTRQNELTSLKRPPKDLPSTENYDVDIESDSEEIMENNSSDYYSKDYDHFSYDEERFDGVKVVISRVDALRKYYNNRLDDYRREISDHVPIKIEIDLRGEGLYGRFNSIRRTN